MIRKGQFNMGLWLGLFAMLMIHVGPLYSALQSFQPAPSLNTVSQAGEHAHPHDHHEIQAAQAEAGDSAHAHHPQRVGSQPAWLAALDLCGYCELLTLNPPVAVSVDLALPWYAPRHFLALPEQPLPQPARRSSGHPRAPPVFLG